MYEQNFLNIPISDLARLSNPASGSRWADCEIFGVHLFLDLNRNYSCQLILVSRNVGDVLNLI
jgi:hypothetical protein